MYEFEIQILPKMDQFRRGCCRVILMTQMSLWKRDIKYHRVIDFGDMVYSNVVNDLTICMAYVMLNPQNPRLRSKQLVPY